MEKTLTIFNYVDSFQIIFTFMAATDEDSFLV